MITALLRTFSALVSLELLSLEDDDDKPDSELSDDTLQHHVFSDFSTLPETHPDVGHSSHSPGVLLIDDPALHDYDTADAFETQDLFDCDYDRSPRSPFGDDDFSDSSMSGASPPSSPMSEDSQITIPQSNPPSPKMTPIALVTNNNMTSELEHHPPPEPIERPPPVTPIEHLPPAPALITPPPPKPQQLQNLKNLQNFPPPRFTPRAPSNSAPANLYDSFSTLQANQARLAQNHHCTMNMNMNMNMMNDTTTHTCPKCGQKFTGTFSLKRHLKKHTGEKPHKCLHPGCSSSFAESTTLKRHMRIHTGEKPYRCNYQGCGKHFAELTTVRRHVITHTGERPYKCPMDRCTRKFSRGSSLKKHMITVHQMRPDNPMIIAATTRSRRERHKKNGLKPGPEVKFTLKHERIQARLVKALEDLHSKHPPITFERRDGSEESARMSYGPYIPSPPFSTVSVRSPPPPYSHSLAPTIPHVPHPSNFSTPAFDSLHRPTYAPACQTYAPPLLTHSALSRLKSEHPPTATNLRHVVPPPINQFHSIPETNRPLPPPPQQPHPSVNLPVPLLNFPANSAPCVKSELLSAPSQATGHYLPNQHFVHNSVNSQIPFTNNQPFAF